MSLGTLFLIVLILMLAGLIPIWPYSQAFGYMPITLLGIVILVILVLLLLGRL